MTQWQQAYRSGGHQPWHLDAEQTAVAFARALGYVEVDQATSGTIEGDDAKIGVGWMDPVPGGGPDQPWSVEVTFSGEPGQVLTIAVTTGRHIREVKRFAVTGVRVQG